MTSATQRTLVYVMSSGTSQIHLLEMNADSGALTRLDEIGLRDGESRRGEGTPMPPGFPLAVSPNRGFLYAAVRSKPHAVVSFRIDPSTGALRRVGEAPLPESMAYIATDNDGRFLLGASFPGDLLSVSPINEDGVAGQPQQIVPTPPRAHSVLPDPSNKFVLAACRDGDAVVVNRFDSTTGEMLPAAAPFASVGRNAGPRHFRFHPNGRVLYLLNERDASIDVFSWDDSVGALQPLQTVSARPPDLLGPASAADLHLTPAADFLYASVRSSNTFAGFRIDPVNGLLSLNDIYPTVEELRGFNVDPSGRYVLVAGERSNDLAAYSINGSNGALTLLGEYAMGVRPNWVEFVIIG